MKRYEILVTSEIPRSGEELAGYMRGYLEHDYGSEGKFRHRNVNFRITPGKDHKNGASMLIELLGNPKEVEEIAWLIKKEVEDLKNGVKIYLIPR
jgi:hypothetical protein